MGSVTKSIKWAMYTRSHTKAHFKIEQDECGIVSTCPSRSFVNVFVPKYADSLVQLLHNHIPRRPLIATNHMVRTRPTPATLPISAVTSLIYEQNSAASIGSSVRVGSWA